MNQKCRVSACGAFFEKQGDAIERAGMDPRTQSCSSKIIYVGFSVNKIICKAYVWSDYNARCC